MDLLKVNNIFFIVLAIMFVSCDGNKIYDTYQPLENSSWSINHSVDFDIEIQDISKPLDVFLNVRNDNNYLFRNLYVISKMTLPDGVILKDTLEYEMSDAYGNWLGEGITDVKNNNLFYLENYTFPQTGNYRFQFTHAMRKRGNLEGLKELTGIKDIGLRIEVSQN